MAIPWTFFLNLHEEHTTRFDSIRSIVPQNLQNRKSRPRGSAMDVLSMTAWLNKVVLEEYTIETSKQIDYVVH